MKCPKCGHENPNDQLFCEECDWKVTEKPRRQRSENFYFYVAMASVVLGLASIIVVLVCKMNSDTPSSFGIWSAVFGGIGLVLASYAMTYVRITNTDRRTKNIMIAVTGVALIISIVGFIIGISIALQ